jgi:hypothetical protein
MTKKLEEINNKMRQIKLELSRLNLSYSFYKDKFVEKYNINSDSDYIVFQFVNDLEKEELIKRKNLIEQLKLQCSELRSIGQDIYDNQKYDDYLKQY